MFFVEYHVFCAFVFIKRCLLNYVDYNSTDKSLNSGLENDVEYLNW
jgi:hypothetical protein